MSDASQAASHNPATDGSIDLAAGKKAGHLVIGKVASPPRRESTSEGFYFWVDRTRLVEKTQLVRVDGQLGGKAIRFFGVIDEVYRQSRRQDIGEEFDAHDGDVSHTPQFVAEGVSFAAVSILRTEPPVLTPPLEDWKVVLGDELEAALAYGADEIDNPLVTGLVKNGADQVAGPGVIDLDYLLGVNGGHMDVNGVAGRGTKSSFLLFVIYMLLREARRRAKEYPSDPNPLMVVPIILNVKGFDLFHIDCWNRRYDPAQHEADWKALGVLHPQPFEGVTFYAPQMPGGQIAVPTDRTGEVKPYSWGLADVVERGLFTYLFADEDTADANFSALALDIESWLTDEKPESDGTTTRKLHPKDHARPQTFQELLDWATHESREKDDNRVLHGHHGGTWAKLRRRLLKLVLEGGSVLRRHDQRGHPLDLAARDTSDPVVVDLNGLARVPALQRFVVATIFRQLIDERTGPNAIHGLRYLIALDELNRFAPRGSHDPITQLIETVAAEMRSQGIILLGAQQQASKVSDRVIDNAAVRVLGRSGTLELDQPVWRFLSDGARRKAAALGVKEKLVIQDNFREPMHVRVPFPVWAMRREEVKAESSDGATNLAPDDDIPTY